MARVEKKQFIIDSKVLFGRRCAKCLVNKPFEEFGVNRNAKFGVTAHCLDCKGYKKRSGRYIPLETKIINGQEVTIKTCRRCKQPKTLDQFNKRKDGAGEVHAECKECLTRRVIDNLKKLPTEQKREYNTIHRLRETLKGKRKTTPKDLTNQFELKHLKVIKKKFPTCAITNLPNPELEHFIPVGIGHGGNYPGNIYRFNRDLNLDKGAKNPFVWKKEIENESWFREDKWNKLIDYLAKENGLTLNEFESFVNWCFDNPRNEDDMKDNIANGIEYNSLNEWKKSMGRE